MIILIKKIPILINLDTYIYIYMELEFSTFFLDQQKEKIESISERILETFRGENWIKIGHRLIKNKEKNSVCAAKRSWKR